ncbi:MAG: hypothetical protein D6692_08670 [Planctomycetota bacterium]|nr:MAG: hypothetical protein D6692_08670 [Planctomycetota bacterium]
MTCARHHPGRPALRAASRPGVSFLEAILGVVLLGLVTASLAGAVSFMHKSEARLTRKLAASELANRLILQFIDDRESLPSRALPIEYGPDLYRWSLEEQPVEFQMETQGTGADTGGVGGGVSLDRVRYVVVRVWLAYESGGSQTFSADVPHATLTRLVDPLAFSNPDSLQTLLEQPDGIERLMQLLMQLEDGTGGATQ